MIISLTSILLLCAFVAFVVGFARSGMKDLSALGLALWVLAYLLPVVVKT